MFGVACILSVQVSNLPTFFVSGKCCIVLFDLLP